MGWIFIDKESDGGSGQIRQHMRRSMRSGNYGGSSAMMRGGGESWEHGYRMGYKHGWEDHDDDWEEMEMRRARDSRGRFV